MWHSMISRTLDDQNCAITKEAIQDVFEELSAQQSSWKISARRKEAWADARATRTRNTDALAHA